MTPTNYNQTNYSSESVALLRSLSAELAPKPTNTAATLQPLKGIRAVVFDVYGTLFISASGDISLAEESQESDLAERALSHVGIIKKPSLPMREVFLEEIKKSHTHSKAAGIDYPEVEVREVWQEVFAICGLADVPEEAREFFAIAFEALSNPVWEMPGARQLIEKLVSQKFSLGIVSNSQFYTPLLFPALLEADLAELSIPEAHCVWSYAERIAKPSTTLYQRSLDVFQLAGIEASEILYVGNDMRNDIWPASVLGMRTALFAGDARSLRLREDDARLSEVTPDVIVTELGQLLEVVT